MEAFSDAELIEDKVFAFALRGATIKQSANMAAAFGPTRGSTESLAKAAAGDSARAPLGSSARALAEWWSSQCGPMMQMLQSIDKVAGE